MENRIMVRKSLVLFLCLIIFSSLLCACHIEQEQSSESDKDSDNILETTEQPITPEWKTAYLDFLEKEKDCYISYALVYIDNDDVPELYLRGSNEATGDSICTYKNSAVVEQSLNRIGGGRYIERSGSVINQNGKMGSIYTHVFKLDSGKFELIFEAHSVERAETLGEDEYRLYCEYSIGQEAVNQVEYDAAIKDAFDFDKSVRLDENSVEYNSICQQIISLK